MTRRFFGLQGALLGVLVIGSCKQDSITTVGIGTPAAVAVEFRARTIAVADSARTFALVRDQVGNPLAVTATVTSCNTGILAVLPASDAPLVRTAFVVKVVGYSAVPVCVVASASGFVDTMKVTTVPGTIVVTGEVPPLAQPDTANSGTVVTYAFQYRDAQGATISGVAAPTFSSADTTIANPQGTPGQVAARAPGLTTITVKGTGGVSTTKTLTVLAVPFTGTTTGPKTPGSFLVIHRDPAGPTFDANTAVSLGAVDSASRVGQGDSILVRVPDTDTAGPHSFVITGIGAQDIAESGAYTAVAPPAFTGTFTPSPMQAGVTLKIARNPGDPPFDSSKQKYFIGRTSPANLAPISRTASLASGDSLSGFKPDTLSVAVSDLKAGGTYYVQATRLGPNNLSWRGSLTLPVGTWGGTVTPNTGKLTDRTVLRRGGGDPLFDADTRVFLNGVRSIVESFSTDTAVVGVPPVQATGAVDLRITHMDAAQLTVVGAGAFTSTSAARIDRFDHGNDQPDTPAPLTANGIYYFTLSGSCSPGAYEGVASIGADDCDDYYKVTNTHTAITDTATVTVKVFWNPGTDVSSSQTPDIDIIVCDGAKLANAPPNNVPQCGNYSDHSDEINFNGATSNRPESTTFKLPPNKTYVVWINMFDAHGAPGTLYQLTLSGLLP